MHAEVQATIEVCHDKLAFARFGTTHAFPFIPAGARLDEIPDGPYVVKEWYGAGTRKVGLNLDREEALEHGATLENVIYQPFVTAQEISIDAWLDRSHRVKGVVLRYRDVIIDGESHVTTTFRNTEIEIKVTQTVGPGFAYNSGQQPGFSHRRPLPKVVIPVHLGGQPCDMAAIHTLAQEYGFRVIEDASHAIGGRYRGKPVGNTRYSDITVFSFHPVKTITTAEGGWR